jgi:undecaprenyl-diphosphatase
MRIHGLFQRMDGYELRMCEALNRISRKRTVRRFFVGISRLGNGVFWYVLIVLLPIVQGVEALGAAIHMTLVGLVGVAVYKYLKSRLVRERPYINRATITLGTAPLDVYSFPSGHTLHAVSFSVVALAYFPHLAALLIPFAALVAMSRVVLGLHYPTDVVAGALLGLGLAYSSFLLVA